MADFMKKVAEESKADKNELSVEERNLLSVAYKNVIGAKRAAWRILSSSEAKAEKDDKNKEICRKFKEKIVKELEDICSEIIGLLDDCLIDNSESNESKVFFNKM